MRRARPADGPAVRDIVFGALRSYGIEPDPDGLDRDVVDFGRATGADGGVLEYVAEVAGVVVGSVVLSPHASPRTGVMPGPRGSPHAGAGKAHLSKLFVAAEARGRGVGRALLAHAVAEARAHGIRRLDLETRSVFREAIGLYEATGWTRGPDLPPGHGPDRTYYLSLEIDTEQRTRVEVDLSPRELERLRLLAQELATSPRDALRQLAGHGRQGWPWLLWLDIRHQLRTLLMQRLRPRGKRVGFKLPHVSDDT